MEYLQTGPTAQIGKRGVPLRLLASAREPKKKRVKISQTDDRKK